MSSRLNRVMVGVLSSAFLVGAIAWSARLGNNMGLYNLFLAAGFAWAIVSRDRNVTLFFLGCMAVAGLFGAATVNPVLLLQAAPPALGLFVAARRWS